MCCISRGHNFPDDNTRNLFQHLKMHIYSKHFLSLSVPQMCFGNRNVLRTLSKVHNPLLFSQRDWVSADGAAFHTQPACTSPSCYRFPWHLERWHDMGVAEARRHHLRSHSSSNISQHFLHLFCVPQTFLRASTDGDQTGLQIFSVDWDQELTEGGERIAAGLWNIICRGTTVPGKVLRKKYFLYQTLLFRQNIICCETCKHRTVKVSRLY